MLKLKLYQTGITLKGSYTYNFRYVQLQVPGKYIPYVYAFTLMKLILELIYYWAVKLFLVLVMETKIYYLEYFRIGHDLPK